MTQIHILDGQDNQILDVITAPNILDDDHYKSLKDTLEMYEFTTFADKRFSQYLTKRNRVIIPGEDGEYIEFIIHEAIKGLNRQIEVYASASYLELKKAKIIRPHTTNAVSAEVHATDTLAGTEWKPGNIAFKGVCTLTIEHHTNPYSQLKRIASEFGLELRFRIETDGNKVIGRYVDMLERVGEWQGREVTFGKDLLGIKRREKTGDIVTALLGIGPIQEDGTRLEVFVEDKDALARWGRNGQHLIEVYEPITSDTEMTEQRLTELTQNELEKRVNAIVEYESEIADLENVPGMENKKIRFGDTMKIKDEKFNPPLYLEARVHTMNRSIKDKSRKRVVLGDYIEYTEEEVNAIWKSLQAEIAKKVSMAEVMEVTYDKQTIDGKDEDVLNDSITHADNVAQTAEENAKSHADTVADEAEQNAKDYTDTVKNQIDTTIQTINNTIVDLETTATNLQQAVADNADELAAHAGRLTTLETDIDNINGSLSATITDLTNLEGTVSQQQLQINANASAIALKADQSELDTLSGNVSNLSGELSVLAGQVALKAEQSALENLEDDVTSISNQVSALQVDVSGISANVSSLESTVNGHTTDIASLSSQLDIKAGQIASKVDATYVQGAIADIEVGGRNLALGTATPFVKNVFAGRQNEVDAIYTVNHSEVGGRLYISFDLELSNLNTNNETSAKVKFQFYTIDINGQELWQNIMTTSNLDSRREHITLPIDRDYSSEYQTAIIQLRVDYITSGTITISNLKLEKGNKATDWTPAPEDVQAEIDSVYNYASSQITQLAGQINLKADATTVSDLESRVSSAEIVIDGLNSQITLKVEEGDVRSIFQQEADSFTFSASQINFDGHVFGENATFNGNIEGATFRALGEWGVLDIDDAILRFSGQKTSGEGHYSTYYQEASLSATEGWLARVFNGIYDYEHRINYDGVQFRKTGGNGPFFNFGVEYSSEANIVRFYDSQNQPLSIDFSKVVINSDLDLFGYLNTTGNITAGGTIYSGDALIRSITGSTFNIGASNFVRIVTSTGFVNNDSFRPLYASEFNPVSDAGTKNTISEWEGNGLEVVNETSVYQYYKNIDVKKEHLKYGFVIGDGYQIRDELIAANGDAIDLYNSVAIAYKSIQELSSLYYDHDERINFLEMENQYLKQKIEQLEVMIT